MSTRDGVRQIRFGVIGCGLMGREFASAAARWLHLVDLDFQPVIVAACDLNLPAAQWFADRVPSVSRVTTDYHALLRDPNIDAIYCALPHNLHQQVFVDIIHAGKHLLGEKPFGIDLAANRAISAAIRQHPELVARCSSEMPFYPGAWKIAEWVRAGRFGKIIEVEAGLWHSSDLNPDKPINWKRQVRFNGEYGCLGDLGMHVLHLPLRFGWQPKNLRALLSKIVPERPDAHGRMVPCETWDNAVLACEVQTGTQNFPMFLSTKRIAPGHANTWFLRIDGMDFSAQYSTKNPKQIAWLDYKPGGEQAWQVMDVPFRSAYPTITGSIFEFGFSDSILQMWAAFCDEVAHGPAMRQPLRCATPEEAAATHVIFTAALASAQAGQTVTLDWQDSDR
jgi:predicted dehydrogenase